MVAFCPISVRAVTKIRTHYDNLKVARDAPDIVIRAAYKTLSQRHHPDKNPGDKNAARIMKILNEAYATLIDPEKRRAHDKWIQQMERSEPQSTRDQRPERPSNAPTKTDSPAQSQPPQPGKQDPEPEPDSALIRRSVLGLSLGALFTVVPFGLILSNSSEKARPAFTQPDPNTPPTQQTGLPPSEPFVSTDVAQLGHVSAIGANVRQGPGTEHPVVLTLRQLDPVSVTSRDGTWLKVELPDGKSGYVSSELVTIGSAEDARIAYCSTDSIDRPRNGEVFKQARTGSNEILVNASGRDAIIKLKDVRGTVLAFYVRSHESARITNVPDGTFEVMFAYGEQFSRRCMEFLQDMSASRDPNPLVLETTMSADRRFVHNVSITYTLTEVANGNFRPESLPVDAFRD